MVNVEHDSISHLRVLLGPLKPVIIAIILIVVISNHHHLSACCCGTIECIPCVLYSMELTTPDNGCNVCDATDAWDSE